MSWAHILPPGSPRPFHTLHSAPLCSLTRCSRCEAYESPSSETNNLPTRNITDSAPAAPHPSTRT